MRSTDAEAACPLGASSDRGRISYTPTAASPNGLGLQQHYVLLSVSPTRSFPSRALSTFIVRDLSAFRRKMRAIPVMSNRAFRRITMRVLAISTTLAVSAMLGSTVVSAQTNTGVRLTATLDGASEAPRPGDPDGTGTASVRINPGQKQLCYSITVRNIAPATMAHIHEAPAGSAGPVVRGLAAPTGGTTQTHRKKQNLCYRRTTLCKTVNLCPACRRHQTPF